MKRIASLALSAAVALLLPSCHSPVQDNEDPTPTDLPHITISIDGGAEISYGNGPTGGASGFSIAETGIPFMTIDDLNGTDDNRLYLYASTNDTTFKPAGEDYCVLWTSATGTSFSGSSLQVYAKIVTEGATTTYSAGAGGLSISLDQAVAEPGSENQLISGTISGYVKIGTGADLPITGHFVLKYLTATLPTS